MAAIPIDESTYTLAALKKLAGERAQKLGLVDMFTCLASNRRDEAYRPYFMPETLRAILYATAPLEVVGSSLHIAGDRAADIARQWYDEKGCSPRTSEQLESIRKYIQTDPGLGTRLEVAPVEEKPRTSDIFYMVSPEGRYGNIRTLQGSPYPNSTVLHERMIWQASRQAIEKAGATVVGVDGFREGGSRKEVWTRDSSLSIADDNGKRIIYLPDPDIELPGYSVGRGREFSKNRFKADAKQLQQAAAERGLNIEFRQLEGVTFEGGQMLVDEKNHTVFAGVGGSGAFFETGNGLFLQQINSGRNRPYQLVKVGTQGRAYHLDLAMAVLPKGELLVDRTQVSDESWKAMTRDYESRIVEIVGEGNRFGMPNLVSVGGERLVMTAVNAETRGELVKRGYEVIVPTEGKVTVPDLNPDAPLIEKKRQIGISTDDGVHCRTQELHTDGQSGVPEQGGAQRGAAAKPAGPV